MSYPINYPTPQGANIQIFRGGDAGATDIDAFHQATRDWVKPQGASFVWFTLIGAGGGGGGSMLDSSSSNIYPGGGGASGNVTNFMCPAFLLPDMLQVAVGRGGLGGTTNGTDNPASPGISGESTLIIYQQSKNDAGYTLLTAYGGGGGAGASFANGNGGTSPGVNPGGPMVAAGFYNSTAGQTGADGSSLINANGQTFILGGNGGYYPNSVVTGYYGYTATLAGGYSQLSPIPLSIPRATDDGPTKQGSNSFGCGGNGGGITNISNGNGGKGGDGLVIIVTW